MLICFFDIRGAVRFEFVIQTFYVEAMKKLIGAVMCKRGKLWRNLSLILDHDIAMADSSLRVSQFLAGKGISAVDYPTYPHDLAPAVFWFLPELKTVLKAKRCSDAEDIESRVKKIFSQMFLFTILKTVLNNCRSDGNILKNFKVITLKNSSLLISAAFKIN
jgi:hypothetical protein